MGRRTWTRQLTCIAYDFYRLIGVSHHTNIWDHIQMRTDLYWRWLYSGAPLGYQFTKYPISSSAIEPTSPRTWWRTFSVRPSIIFVRLWFYSVGARTLNPWIAFTSYHSGKWTCSICAFRIFLGLCLLTPRIYLKVGLSAGYTVRLPIKRWTQTIKRANGGSLTLPTPTACNPTIVTSLNVFQILPYNLLVVHSYLKRQIFTNIPCTQISYVFINGMLPNGA